MKIKNIIPIFTALIVVACSTRNNNSAENLNLRLERAELSFYTEILDGELATLADRLTDSSLPTVRYRRESFNEGLFTFFKPGGLDNTPLQATVTNDTVEYLYVDDSDGNVLTIFNSAVQTRRGGVAGNVPQKFWRNAVITKQASVVFYVPVTPRPTIFASATGTEEAVIDADFSLLVSEIRRNGAVLGQTNIGRTETLSTVGSRIEEIGDFFPEITDLAAILISTNATTVEYREIAVSGTGDTRRYFLREGDRGAATYTRVE